MSYNAHSCVGMQGKLSPARAITVVRVEVPCTQLVCTASDHLPLLVEVRFEG